jgi:protein-disulfide isomerase/uncharacterized membrane protein
MSSAVLLRLSALVAMAASAALFMQYVDPVGASFCGADSGCEEVRRSGLGYFFLPYLNLPLVGLIGYGTVLLTSIKAPTHRIAPWLAVVGAVGAVVFIGLQAFYVGAFCWLCLTVDVAGIAAGVFGVLQMRGPAPREILRPGAWATLAGIGVVAAPAYSQIRPAPPVPAPVRALYEPGKINVIEFADFQCPFCRALHPLVKEALSGYPADRVHLRRMNVPLPFHQYAMPMAMGYVCADQQGKGEQAADALVEIEPSEDAVPEMVQKLGLDVRAFEACIDDPQTEARIQSETEVLEQAGMLGLPTTYIGGKRMVGTVSVAALRDAMDKAARGEEDHGVPWPLFLGVVALGLGATVRFGRARDDDAPAPQTESAP